MYDSDFTWMFTFVNMTRIIFLILILSAFLFSCESETAKTKEKEPDFIPEKGYWAVDDIIYKDAMSPKILRIDGVNDFFESYKEQKEFLNSRMQDDSYKLAILENRINCFEYDNSVYFMSNNKIKMRTTLQDDMHWIVGAYDVKNHGLHIKGSQFSKASGSTKKIKEVDELYKFSMDGDRLKLSIPNGATYYFIKTDKPDYAPTLAIEEPAELMDSSDYSGIEIGDGTIARYSSNNEVTWDSAKVIQVSELDRSILVGHHVLVIPKDNSLPIIKSTICELEFHDGPARENVPLHEVGPIADSVYLNHIGNPDLSREYLGTALIIPFIETPPVRLDIHMLDEEDIPSSVYMHNISIALDFDGDNKPDIIYTQYCCKDASQNGNCEYNCTAIYRKSFGSWEEEDIPMGC